MAPNPNCSGPKVAASQGAAALWRGRDTGVSWMYKVVGSLEGRAFRVLWTLEELQVAYEHQPGEQPSGQSRAHDRANRVPILIADGETLRDPVAIMQYLTDRHGALTYGPGTLARARQDSLTYLILENLEGPLWDAARNWVIDPHILRSPAIVEGLHRAYQSELRRIADGIPHNRWAAGDVFTIADIMLVHCILWAALLGFPRYPEVLRGYLLRIDRRLGFQRALSLGSGEVEATLAAAHSGQGARVRDRQVRA
jgi:glutathione S-transferase